MSWPFWLCRKADEFITAAKGGPWPAMQAQALRLDEQIREVESKQPLRTVGGAVRRERPRTGVDKSALPFAVKLTPTQRDRRAERRPEMSRMRWAVLQRSNRLCEFCRCDESVEAHHVLGGADRVALESEYTLAAICEDCHGRCTATPTPEGDRGPAWARRQAHVWALRMASANVAGASGGDPAAIAAVAGFTVTAELLEGRIALAAAQATASITTTDTEEPT